MIGQTISHYKIIEKLGGGEMFKNHPDADINGKISVNEKIWEIQNILIIISR